MITLSYAGLAGIPKVAQGSGKVGFACTSSYCYTSGAQYANVFQLLQQYLNSVAKLNNERTQISVDGRIGAGTVQLAQKLAYLYMGRNQSTLSTLILTDGGVKEDIAANAPEIISELQRIIATTPGGSATVSTTTVPGGGQVPTGPGPGTGPLPPYTTVSVTSPANLPGTPVINPWNLQTTPGQPGMSVPPAGPQIDIPNSSVPYDPYAAAAAAAAASAAATKPSMSIAIALGVVGVVGIGALLFMGRKDKGL